MIACMILEKYPADVTIIESFSKTLNNSYKSEALINSLSDCEYDIYSVG